MWRAVVPIVRGTKEEVKELVIVVVIHQAVVEPQLGSQVHFFGNTFDRFGRFFQRKELETQRQTGRIIEPGGCTKAICRIAKMFWESRDIERVGHCRFPCLCSCFCPCNIWYLVSFR